jgi:hypothetical protein
LKIAQVTKIFQSIQKTRHAQNVNVADHEIGGQNSVGQVSLVNFFKIAALLKVRWIISAHDHRFSIREQEENLEVLAGKDVLLHLLRVK